MLRSIRFFIMFLFIGFSLVSSPVVQAQKAGGGGGSAEGSERLLGDSVNDFITVGALGGVGFVLGLSTLSFVDEPTDHLKNLWVGFAIGIIAGVGVVAWKQANKSQQEIYQSRSIQEFGTMTRLTWHQKEFSQNESQGVSDLKQEPLQLNYKISF